MYVIKLFFNPFKIVLKIFSKVSVFAVHFHFHVFHQKHQSWLGFVRFCFSAFAPHHWLVGDRRKFFPSLVIVFPPLVSVVFLLWSIYCPLQGYFRLLGQESICEGFKQVRIVFLENVGLTAFSPNETILASSPVLQNPIGPRHWRH